MDDFLSAVWPDYGYGEIRAIRMSRARTAPTRVVEQRWFNLPGDRSAAAHTAAYFDTADYDAYFGVLPRVRANSTDYWPNTGVLWADVDAKHHDDDKQAALDAILMYELPASIIVDSAHGFHCYYLLRDSVPFAEARLAMQGIAKAIGGDAVYDAARILRIPGTVNHKDPAAPERVRLLRLDTTRRFRFSDFHDAMESVIPVRSTPLAWTVQRRETQELPQWLLELINHGASRGARSEAVFKAVVWLLRYEWTEQEIGGLFDSFPIGEKYRERGPKWLARTIDKARAVA